MKIITLCGSLKFQKEMMEVAEKIALEGNCVLTPVYPTLKDYKRTEEQLQYLKEAHFKIPSTTDYNGIYKGKYIDFEAKETNSKTSFPLDNIHKHQIKHLENVYNNDGIGFIIVRFNKLNKTYILMAKDLLSFLKENKRKSIPLKYFEDYAYLIEDKYIPRLDYLKIIDELLGGA